MPNDPLALTQPQRQVAKDVIGLSSLLLHGHVAGEAAQERATRSGLGRLFGRQSSKAIPATALAETGKA